MDLDNSKPEVRAFPELISLGSDEFRTLASFVESSLGIRMGEEKRTFLETRLMKRLRALGLQDYNTYARLLASPEGSGELRHFIDAVTTNTTEFFREQEHFSLLERKLVPFLAQEAGTEHRFWSSASSSGQEAYTLAMVLAEASGKYPGFLWSILATDISGRMLQTGRDAVYPEDQLKGIPEELQKKYLLRGKGAWKGSFRICPELREKVLFRKLNLLDETYPFRQKFDGIFCRNVIIYFKRDTQRAVLNRIISHLRPGGFLFLGHAESINGLGLPLEIVAPTTYRLR